MALGVKKIKNLRGQSFKWSSYVNVEFTKDDSKVGLQKTYISQW